MTDPAGNTVDPCTTCGHPRYAHDETVDGYCDECPAVGDADHHDFTEPLTLKELTEKQAILKALSDRIADEYKATRLLALKAATEARRTTGTKSIGIEIGGVQVASLSVPELKPEARVDDMDAVVRWAVANAPGEIVRRIVTEVRPAFITKILAEMTAAGVAEICDKESGVVQPVPGVSVVPREQGTHRLTFRKTGREDIAAWWMDEPARLRRMLGT